MLFYSGETFKVFEILDYETKQIHYVNFDITPTEPHIVTRKITFELLMIIICLSFQTLL